MIISPDCNMDLVKKTYVETYRVSTLITKKLNRRLFNTYNRIAIKVAGKNLDGKNLDLGCGDKGFSLICQEKGIKSYAFDYPELNLEKDVIPLGDNMIDFVTMNAVIEHIAHPSHILTEVRRVLKRKGLFFIRTPNWQIDFKNFYNDPTHVKPYTPNSLKRILELLGFSVIFLEPGLIEKSWFWWKLPNLIKWRLSSWLKGGTKSIIAVAQVRNG